MNKKPLFSNALASLHPLPSPRGAALHMIHIARRENASFEEIVRVTRTDPALCGRLIQAANRLRHESWEPTGALEVAVQRLGLTATRQIALGFSIVGEHRSGNCTAFDYENFWTGSLLRGLAAQALARRFRQVDPSEAFVLGLLLDIGRLAFAGVRPDVYAALLKVNPHAGEKLRAAERASFGIDHGELGATLMEQWMLPKETIRAVRSHFGSPDCGAPSVAEHWKLHIAEAVVQAAMAPARSAPAWTHVALDTAARAGIDPDTLEEVVLSVADEAAQWAPLLHLPVPRTLNVDIGGYVDLWPDADADHPVTPAQPGPELRVLLVDDDELELLLLRPILEKKGYRVQTALSAEESLESILDAPPDIVITDWQMPGMSGPELCRVLRATRIGARLHLIVRTGKSRDEDLVTAIHAGANDFVSKNSAEAVLLARVHAGAGATRRCASRAHETSKVSRKAAELAVAGLI